MRTKLLSAVAAVAFVATVAPATAATFPVGTTQPGASFIASPGANGTFNGAIARSGIANGTFTDVFTFTLPTNGLGTGTASTSNFSTELTGLNFTSVFFNDVQLPINVLFGTSQVAGAKNLPIVAGMLNKLTINGMSYGSASYSASLTFKPTVSAVPETATWMMMLAGFGMMGAGLRYRRRSSTVAFA